MDTTELGAGQNPVPDEEEDTKAKYGTITVTFNWEDGEIPTTWDNKKLEEFIQENWREYMQEFAIIEDITVKN